jgi:hypothetical protein
MVGDTWMAWDKRAGVKSLLACRGFENDRVLAGCLWSSVTWSIPYYTFTEITHRLSAVSPADWLSGTRS